MILYDQVVLHHLREDEIFFQDDEFFFHFKLLDNYYRA